MMKAQYVKPGLLEFFADHGIDPDHVSPTVYKMMDVQNEDKKSKTVGGYLRTLYVQKGGSTTLPSEYFGNNSGAYFSDVSARNMSDATPVITRPAINATFKGGNNSRKKKYPFVTVSDLKKLSTYANREDKDLVNKMLFDIYSNAIHNKKITVNSLKKAFNV